MQKEIKIGEDKIPMRATAATAYRYRQVFRGDLLIELSKTKNDEENVEIIEKLAYIMESSAAGADMGSLTEEGFVTWLEKYETIDLMNALPEVVGLYMASKASSSTTKKK